MSLLEVSGLRVTFSTPDGDLQAVRGVSFEVEAGQTLGVVGESGSGKSVSVQALLGLIPGARVEGSALFDGEQLIGMPAEKLRRIRGARIGMIFQDPLSSLHPMYSVGRQIAEAILVHRKVSKDQAWSVARERLEQVGIPAVRARDYPHQFSGGMRQRVMIAMAMALDPELIIADEPTTALDATVRAQILELLGRLGCALIIITHDLGVIADMADQVMVMYAGKPVEKAERRALFRDPRHPYTRGLLNSLPKGKERLQPIEGRPPSLLSPPTGCSFHPRCPVRIPRCPIEEPPMLGPDDHPDACWLEVGR
ncbi:ABC transporter ATP-binding protein [Herbidospora mongoliensis]|uniref:ABC transporter ATP-binding protein n=1 Tax=Herbidospora mongoliensis TaxID=688067 RepID=UPI00082C8ADA|nr:ABC transporter ATP-binding protein [Herbidospora mongoliensis]